MTESEGGWKGILDLTRLFSLVLLGLHLYFFGYRGWRSLGWVPKAGALTEGIYRTGLFRNFLLSKVLVLGLMGLSLLGVQGRRDRSSSAGPALGMVLGGLGLYWISGFCFWSGMTPARTVLCYGALTLTGLLVFMTGGIRLGRVLELPFRSDLFNRINQSFPQQERRIDNPYSINLPHSYRLLGKTRQGWINIINPFRGLLVLGSPGSGKSYSVIRQVICQHLAKGFTMMVYDFKYDDLSRIVYNAWLRWPTQSTRKPAFRLIHFQDLARSQRCNPLDPASMTDISDAGDAARTILMGLNREWIRRQGDFFVESPIHLVTALIWFLKKYQEGVYCTLPHVIELMQLDYDRLFSVLRSEPEVSALVNPFLSAYRNFAMEQLEGQVASAKIALARLVSPQLYYILSGNDFTLDLNDPKNPQILCLGNYPPRQHIFGPVLALFVSRLIKLVNRKGMLPCSLVMDEFPTIYFNAIDSLMATARSNRVAVTLALQDYSQLRKDYGREQAEVILHIAGNIICGQVSGDTARILSERFGRILQERQSISVNRQDTSLSHTGQPDTLMPPSVLASLSSGEFAGMVADDPKTPLEQKMFHGTIQIDHRAISRQEQSYAEIPVLRQIGSEELEQNFIRIKMEVAQLVDSVLDRMMHNPAEAALIVRRPRRPGESALTPGQGP